MTTLMLMMLVIRVAMAATVQLNMTKATSDIDYDRLLNEEDRE